MQFLAVDDEPVLLSRCSSLPGSEGGSKAGRHAGRQGRKERVCMCVGRREQESKREGEEPETKGGGRECAAGAVSHRKQEKSKKEKPALRVSERVMKKALCSVLVMHRRKGGKEAADEGEEGECSQGRTASQRRERERERERKASKRRRCVLSRLFSSTSCVLQRKRLQQRQQPVSRLTVRHTIYRGARDERRCKKRGTLL